jgi:hypothetical protein
MRRGSAPRCGATIPDQLQDRPEDRRAFLPSEIHIVSIVSSSVPIDTPLTVAN